VDLTRQAQFTDARHNRAVKWSFSHQSEVYARATRDYAPRAFNKRERVLLRAQSAYLHHKRLVAPDT